MSYNQNIPGFKVTHNLQEWTFQNYSWKQSSFLHFLCFDEGEPIDSSYFKTMDISGFTFQNIVQ